MLKNFAFDDSGVSPDDDDPLSCPGNLLDQPSLHAMATSESPEPDGAHIDGPAGKMGKQRSTGNSQSFLSLEAQSSEAGWNPSTEPDHAPIQIQIQPASIPSIELDSKQPTEPIMPNPQPQFQPQHRRHESIDSQSDLQSDDSIAGDAELRVRKRNRFWRSTKKPLRSASPSKPRRPDLMADMIESGEQCNVHNAAPQPSTGPSQPLPAFLINLMASAKFDDNMNTQFVDDDTMELVVDKDHCGGQDEAAGPSSSITLRDAGGPAGIKKVGRLRYRTSIEAASRCKNMKRSVPRMRRRPKTYQSESTPSRPESRASTNPTSL
ncbi:hypothetical protein F4820DRAFT_450452 [Hypoxylon rubiginosum]|uniref:Uncharacterized protein n=1 Tax=Hypoxylon rubiginosum TaxID=110542 RepID=A0ACB9YUP2_9PEZI|nr:hypothetical protein F4820DRAFT_450452 [Hypoxylon rubiginosum]